MTNANLDNILKDEVKTEKGSLNTTDKKILKAFDQTKLKDELNKVKIENTPIKDIILAIWANGDSFSNGGWASDTLEIKGVKVGDKMIKIWQKSEAIFLIQVFLQANGQKLTHWGADGWYGGETQGAAFRYYVEHTKAASKEAWKQNDSKIDKMTISKDKEKIILANIKDIDLKAYAAVNKAYDFWFKLAIEKWIMDKDYEIKDISLNRDKKEIIIKSNISGVYGKEYKMPLWNFMANAQTWEIDTDKFVNQLNENVIKQMIVANSVDAKNGKYNDYANSYKYLTNTIIGGRGVDLKKNLSTNYIKDTENNIKSLKTLSDNIKKDWTMWLDTKNNKYRDPRSEKLVNDIAEQVKSLEGRVSYLKMKAWDEVKVKWFEDFLKKSNPKTAGERMAFQNEINTKKVEYKTFRDGFIKRWNNYIGVSYTDWAHFDARLNVTDKTYGYTKITK